MLAERTLVLPALYPTPYSVCPSKTLTNTFIPDIYKMSFLGIFASVGKEDS